MTWVPITSSRTSSRVATTNSSFCTTFFSIASPMSLRCSPAGSAVTVGFTCVILTLEELQALHVWERMNPDGSPVYPQRYPANSGNFHISTLREELAFIQRLNEQTGRSAGIYPEIKRPAWHKTEGVDVAPLLLEQLAEFGYENRDDPVFLQCFDDAELRRLKQELECPFRLVQLIGENSWREAETDFDALRTPQGIKSLAQTVDAIGPHLLQLYQLPEAGAAPVDTGLVNEAHEAGLLVHPFTFRADEIPPGFASFAELVRYFVVDLGVDGLFTDFPDQVLALRFS